MTRQSTNVILLVLDLAGCVMCMARQIHLVVHFCWMYNVRTHLDIICMWLCIFMTCGHYIKISITFLYVLKIVFFFVH